MHNRGALYLGILFIVLGGFFLLAQSTGWLGLGWKLWPLLVLIAGLAFLLPLAIWWHKRSELAGLVVPGTILAGNGLLMLFQSLTGNWSSWSYTWALEPILVALGLLFLYLLTNRPRGLLTAVAIVGGVGLLLFVTAASAFGGVLRYVGPVLLIAVGLVILLAALKGQPGNNAPNE